MKTLFLAWRDPQAKAWFPVGRLTLRNGTYQFVYTHGARQASTQCGFQPLPMFRSFDYIYESQQLFPLFLNRAPSINREDLFEFVQWLNLPQSQHDPLAVLARSGGRRATDTFEIFPCPEREPDGSYRLHFFVHGISYLDERSVKRIEHLQSEEQLLVMWDLQNPYDPCALALRTNGATMGDRVIVGYCPRYLTQDWFNLLLECDAGEAKVRVERLNPAPAPLEFRLLCRLTGCWPPEFQPCCGEQYLPVVESATLPTRHPQS